jgi:hypothetical protein
MNTELESLPQLIRKAVAALATATTAAEILDVQRQADIAYTAAKHAARLRDAKDAADTVVAACRKVQADAVIIETQAHCRLADEYDAAQKRGEVRGVGEYQRKANVPNENISPTVTDIGLDRKQIHEARIVRDAEKKKPGVIKQTLEQRLRAGKEPTRADVRRVARDTIATKEPPRPSVTAGVATPAAKTSVAPDASRHQAKADEINSDRLAELHDEWERSREEDLKGMDQKKLVQLWWRMAFFDELAHYHELRANYFKGMLVRFAELCGEKNPTEYEDDLDQKVSDRFADIAAGVDAAYDKVEWRDKERIEWTWQRDEEDENGDE